MNVLFRADASVRIGTGHVMRCLALAQAVQDAAGGAVFAMAETTPAITARLATESCDVVCVSGAASTRDDVQQTISLARQRRADWIVVDGYQFDANYQDVLRDAGCKVLFVDDYGHASRYSAQLVLNQNAGASEKLYANRAPDTRLLLGPRYALLRREFSKWRDWKREMSPVCRRLLVMMGGSDPDNLTARAIEGLMLARVENLKATVVVGGSNPHLAMLHTLAADSRQKIVVRNDVTNVAELMAEADIAISAAGSTCWELCLLGLPALLIDMAANQSAVAKELDRSGCAIHLGDQTIGVEKIARELPRLVHSLELRQSLSENARELVDGKGAERVASVLRGEDQSFCEDSPHDSDTGLRLRRACADDSRLLWEWANDREVRAASFLSEPISWETHAAWFGERLSRSGTLMWIAQNGDGKPCGQIRFDARPDGDWEVDVSVTKTMRGRGLASRLIALGVEAIAEEHRRCGVHAFVKPGNSGSLGAFEKAGFKRLGVEEIRGHAAVHFVWQKAKPV
jgi:UDP-2,4-diacetamido-2,4,6-trideoxy-beta-L-altropyranose hydrolase